MHVLAHMYLARALAPRMAARGRGHLLLTNMDSAPYWVTKHGTVALAEWLALREFERRWAADRDRWLAGMRRARARLRS